jgi:GH25 family lysozyme M1 (1,4-beta-N-acetylmuramidase)
VTLQAVGPDVSRWQGSVDWNKVLAAGAGIGIAKATEGIDFVDPTFTPARYKAMQKAGCCAPSTTTGARSRAAPAARRRTSSSGS